MPVRSSSQPTTLAVPSTAVSFTVGFVAGPQPPFELRLLRADGAYRWAEDRITNLLDEPDVAGLVINFRDIEDRRELAGRSRPGLSVRVEFGQVAADSDAVERHRIEIDASDTGGERRVIDELSQVALVCADGMRG